jgi:hypothetical protein
LRYHASGCLNHTFSSIDRSGDAGGLCRKAQLFRPFRLRKKSQTASEVPTRAKAPNFIAQCLSGFENPLPRTKVQGYTRISVFPQPVLRQMAG